MDDKSTEVQITELKLLFKHLVVFLFVSLILKIINRSLMPQWAWSNLVITIWSFFLFAHVMIIFLSQGIFGDKWENRTAYDISSELIEDTKTKVKSVTPKVKIKRTKPDVVKTTTPNN